MSGICGIVCQKRREDLRPLLESMLAPAVHRGPDGTGRYVNEEAALGHHLLRLQSRPMETPQPSSNGDRTLWITLDGTIFNRDELLAALASAGRPLQVPSEASLFLSAFEVFGPSCLDQIDGIFSVAIWDTRRKVLFCARDRIGVKPFFYARWEGMFLFGSELNQILVIPGFPRRPNEGMVGDYLGGDIDLHDETFFEGIYRLPAGNYALIQDGKIQIKTYWDIDPSRQTVLSNDDAYGDRFRELFTKAVQKNLDVDVPVGSNLSGGLDSSSIVCVTDSFRKRRGETLPLETFSLTFEDKACDERPHIQAVGSKAYIVHNQYLARGEEFFKEIQRVQDRQAEPFRSIGVVLFWKLKQLAYQKGMRVMLNGMGADEVLGGINLYYLADMVREGRWLKLRETLKALTAIDPFALSLSPRRLLFKFGIRPLIPPALNRVRKNLQGCPYPDFIDPEFAKRIHLSERLCPSRSRRFKDIYRQMAYEALRHHYTPLLLHYEDTNGAGFGTESRFPFLDKDLVEYLFSLPHDKKIRNGVAKIVLRNGMKGILPETIRTRVDKGFIDKQVDHWLGHQFSEEIERVLWGSRLKDVGYFNIPRLQQIYREYQSGHPGRLTIWKSFNLGIWLDTFFK